ncbi:MAG: hypothetical protein J7M34_00585 [Anaerolineae bacterium]|nr:hypothetical protein [Anaerolineae bacterium]
MEIERLFGRTRREVARQREPAGQTWLRRAGYLRMTAGGTYTWLPLGAITLDKIRRLCVDAVSDVQPLSWRGGDSGAEIANWLCELTRSEIRSYRQLPQRLQWDKAPDVASLAWLEATQEELEASTSTTWDDWHAIWTRLGLEAQEIATVPRVGSRAKAWATPCAQGPDHWLVCSACSYAGEPGTVRPQIASLPEEPPEEMEKVATPGCETIQDVADYLGVPTSHTLKAVFYATAEGHIVFAVIRGDLEVDPEKLARVTGHPLHPATAEELNAAGIVAGYASPIGITPNPLITVVGDPSIQANINFVAGANQAGYHLRGVRYPRDFQVDALEDIVQAEPGDACPVCGAPLEAADGLTLTQLETISLAEATYLDSDGRPQSLHAAVARVDLGRILVAIAEAHHDDYGLILPPIVAPYDAHIVILSPGRPDVAKAADELALRLTANGWLALWDRRDESAGVKFTDADLIGLPWRITISPRSLKRGGIEVKARAEDRRSILTIAQVPEALPTHL